VIITTQFYVKKGEIQNQNSAEYLV